MKIAIACGGTGGHIFPGLAVAKILKERGHDIRLWTAGKNIEHEALQEWQGKITTVPSRGFQGHNLFRHFRTAFNLMHVSRSCIGMMRSDRPDLVLAMGSYASIGPGLAAAKLGIPLVLHEANVIPGRAIRLLSRRADKIALHFEETSYYLRRKRNVEVTGMPLRSDLQGLDSGAKGGGDDNFTLLIMGGSGGAHALNEICADSIISLNSSGNAPKVIHLSGLADEEMVRARYRDGGVRAEVHGFHHDMGALYSRADLAICRAGASTCAELNAFALPSLLVPYPHAANDHQMRNAEAMEKRGGANLISQTDLNSEWLAEYLQECASAPGRLERMRANIRRHRNIDGADILANLIESVQKS